jgi:DNA-binding NarL/FixJ family response regulator
MRHVMFVDDNPSALSGIRWMLHPRRSPWRMTFTAGRHEPVRALADDPAHVVVSDMRMPGMDGAELLSVVRHRWPGAVRVILSGVSEDSAALRGVPMVAAVAAQAADG